MNNKQYWIIGGAAAIVILAFAIFFKNDKTTYSWGEHYKSDRKDPYGLFVVHEMLNNYSQADNLVELDLKLSELEAGAEDETVDNFVFIGPAIRLDSINLLTLLDFVQKGNRAFISSKTIPTELMEVIYPERCLQYGWTDYITRKDSVVSLNLMHPNLQDSLGFDFRFFQNHQPVDYNWKYIDPDYFCDTITSLVELGAYDELDINFARKDYGDGIFYLHTTPLSFTNFELMDTLGLAYAGNVFSHLGPGKIYWDEVHKIPERVGRGVNKDYSNYDDSLASDGPLIFIMGNKSLRNAWYLLLAMGLFFILFRTKRNQRIIPILESNRNTSLDFISTIGSLYFLQNDHYKLSKQQGKLFLGYVRSHYDINTSQLDENFKNRLEAKSEVPKDLIEKIITLWTNINGAKHISENTMVDFYKLLNQFYTTCK